MATNDTPKRPRKRTVAARLRPPRWRDPRVVVGVLVVVACVLGTFALVRSSADTIMVYAAARPLAPGQALGADDLNATEVKLPRSAAYYLSADAAPPEGSVVLEPVAEGELVPRRALGTAEQVAGRAVAIDLPGSLPGGVRRGSRVDVWATPRPGLGEETADPRQILADVPVLAAEDDPAGLGASDAARIEVFVAADDLGTLMTALAGENHLSVVVIPGAGR